MRHECPECKIELVLKVQFEVNNCPDGCCPTFVRIYQCPKCKEIFDE